jgi:hypothetical protein
MDLDILREAAATLYDAGDGRRVIATCSGASRCAEYVAHWIFSHARLRARTVVTGASS